MAAELWTPVQEITPTQIAHEGARNQAGETVPYAVEMPNMPRDDVAFLFTHGWLATGGVYADPRRELVERTGIAAITYDDALEELSHDLRQLRPKKIFDAVEDKLTDNVLAVCTDASRKYGYQGFYIIGHSKGGLVGAVAAGKYHNEGMNVEGLSLQGAAGIASTNVVRTTAQILFEHALRDEAGQTIRHPVRQLRMGGQVVKQALDHPFVTAAMGIYAGTAKAHTELAALGLSGVKLHAAVYGGDGIFHEQDQLDGLDNIPGISIQRFGAEYCHNAIVHEPKVAIEGIVGTLLERCDRSVA